MQAIIQLPNNRAIVCNSPYDEQLAPAYTPYVTEQFEFVK